MKAQLTLLLWALLASTQLFSQGTALVTGKVTDADLGEVLPLAQVSIDGTNNGTSTNMEGIYQLRIPAGVEVKLHFNYLGYKDSVITVQLSDGETKVQDIGLKANSVNIQTVEVKGQLQGQARALNNQKNADNIVSVISADQIGRFPDQNTAEALQRVSGVNVQNDQGEGRYVLVRGLAPQFTNININGEQIPSPEADVRFVALDAISSTQLASMEVSKTLTPDMDGDAIGGSVNLITKTATSSSPEFNASWALGYNYLMDEPNSNTTLQYGQRFLKNDKLGVMVNFNHSTNNLGSDNWEREPFDNELELRDYELTRTRLGASTSIDYKFNENSSVYFRSIFSEFTDREWRRATVFIPGDDEIERSTKDRFEAQSIQAYNLGGKHILPKFQIDYEVQYSFGEQDTPYDNESTFIAGIPSTVDFSNKDFPVLDAPGYLNNQAYDFDELEVGNTLAEDQNITAKFNIGIPYKVNDQTGLIKFGSKVRLKEKSLDITTNKYESLGGVPTLDAFEGGLLDDNFLGGEYELSRATDIPTLIDYLNQNPQQFELQVEDKAIDEALEAFEANEDVYAGYLMAKHNFKKLSLIAGVRYELTQVDYESKDVVIAPNGDLLEIIDRKGSTEYGFILPQISAKYSLNSNTNIRAAATYSYSRPNFSDIVPSQEANLEDNEATVGNPLLEPVKAMNFDLMGEHFFSNVGIVSAGVFYKRLDDFIYPEIIYNSQYPLNGTPIVSGIRVNQSQNGESADLLGVEFAFQRTLSFLPGFLKNLNLYLNYTYTDSDSKIQSRRPEDEGLDRVESIKLPGQATSVGNASLAYRDKHINLRASVNFNGEYLDEVGGVEAEDVYIKSRLQLDVSASYFLSKSTIIFVELMNLTDQPFEAYQGDEDIIIQREFYGSWSRIGVKLNLANLKTKK